jgi:hypothetical protein
MAGETAGLEIVRLVLFPAAGFLAGFAAQWFLQARRSRDEMVRALASERAAAVRALWAITTLPGDIAALDPAAEVPVAARQRLNGSIVEWYTAGGGALYLSWDATQRVFELLDTLRSDEPRKSQLEERISALRTRLKHDCGIYTKSETGRPLKRPRPSPWKAP